MLRLAAGRVVLETSGVGTSVVRALTRCSQRKVSTEVAHVDPYPNGVISIGRTRKKTVSHATVDPNKQKKLLTPYELSKRIKALCDKGDLNAAITKLKESPRDAQNAAVWGTLIHDVMGAGKYKEGYRLFTDMKRRGISPTTRTYSTLLGGYLNIENWERFSVQLENVCSIYTQLQRHHEEVKRRDPQSPELSDIPYTQLIRIFGQAQDFHRMYDVFNSMPPEGPLAPSVHTYTSLLNALGNRKASALVPSISILRDDGEEERPTEPSYHELMFKNSTDAKLVWRQLIQASKKSPGPSIDSHALRALVKILSRGRPSDQAFAFDVVHEYLGLAKPGQQPIPPKVELHPLTLESLLLACNNAQKYNFTLHYVQQIIDSDSALSRGQNPLGLRRLLNTRHMDIILEAHATRAALGSSDESEDALETLEWMLRMEAVGPAPGKDGGIGPQIRPATSTYDLVALTCWRNVDWKRMCRVFELMTGYDTAYFCGNMHETPQQERRSKGRNLTPTPSFMVSMINTAIKTYQDANLQQTLNILGNYGLDTICALDHPTKRLSQLGQKEKRECIYFASKLAQIVARVVPAALTWRHTNKETQARWTALLQRAEAMVKADSGHEDEPQ